MYATVGRFGALVLLLSTALAQADLLSVLAQLPTCTDECSLKILTPAKCAVTDLPTCLCTNVTLQRDLALCVVGSCNLTEQATTLTVTQQDICVGVPQPSRSAEIIRDILIIAGITFPVILLRFISRSLVTSRLWWDDWTIALAALTMVPMTVIPILVATRGFGKHFWDVHPQDIIMLRKLYYVSQVLYVLVQNLAKFSILLLYLRIFVDKRFRLITNIVIGWVVCHTIVFVLVVIFQCTPVEYVWDTSLGGKCINSQAMVFSGAAFSILEDFVIILLPVWELKALRLDLRKRIALGFMFALGSFACVTSMVRLKYIISYGTSIDLTYDNVDVVIWSVLEAYTAIMCASLMCLRPLLVRLLPTFFPTTNRSTSKNTPNNPTWASKLASKMRSGHNGVELQSEDGNRGGEEDAIRVEKTWVTGTTLELQDHSSTSGIISGTHSTQISV